MKIFRFINSGAILLTNILVFGCLSCYAAPHNDDTPCHEVGHHHSEECNVCQIAQKAWDVKLVNNQNKEEKYLQDVSEPEEDFVFKLNQNNLLFDTPFTAIGFNSPDPWVETIVNTIVLRI